MTEEKVRRLEDVECAILNENWIKDNQQLMRGAIKANPAEVKSPGLKAQVLFAEHSSRNKIYCPRYDSDDESCTISGEECMYSLRE